MKRFLFLSILLISAITISAQDVSPNLVVKKGSTFESSVSYDKVFASFTLSANTTKTLIDTTAGDFRGKNTVYALTVLKQSLSATNAYLKIVERQSAKDAWVIVPITLRGVVYDSIQLTPASGTFTIKGNQLNMRFLGAQFNSGSVATGKIGLEFGILKQQ